MRNPFSIVIVCRNEAHVIGALLQSAQQVTDDVVVYDNGSTDDTLSVVQQFNNVKLHQGPWEGFGKTKQKATALAKHAWVLSLDADEALDEPLQQELQQLELDDPKKAYNIPYKNFLGSKHLKWGEWGFDSHVRLFHKSQGGWNDAPVHETLVLAKDTVIVNLKGHVLHRTIRDMGDYSSKVMRYALLNAEKYHQRGKKAGFIKRFLAPPFTFLKFYVFQLGFLDGWEGLVCARMTAYYTFLKYARLRELEKSGTPETGFPKPY